MQSSRRISLDIAHPGRVFVVSALVVLLVDQATKAVVRATMPVGVSKQDFIPHVIDLTSVRNSGAAFGIFPGQRPVFVMTSLLVLFAIAALWRRTRPQQWPIVVGLAVLAGGCIGNLIDRALIGYVTDFFEFAFVQFPVFNVADIGIVSGVAVLMVWILFGPELSTAAEKPAVGEELGPDLERDAPDDPPT